MSVAVARKSAVDVDPFVGKPASLRAAEGSDPGPTGGRRALLRLPARPHNTDLKIQASAPAAATSLSTSTAALYNISASDLPKLTAEVRKFNVNLGAWYLAQQNYLYQQKVAKKKPDPKVLVNNQWQRQRLVMNAHAGIRGAIQRSSWAGLHGYITGAFATSLQQAKGAAQ